MLYSTSNEGCSFESLLYIPPQKEVQFDVDIFLVYRNAPYEALWNGIVVRSRIGLRRSTCQVKNRKMSQRNWPMVAHCFYGISIRSNGICVGPLCQRQTVGKEGEREEETRREEQRRRRLGEGEGPRCHTASNNRRQFSPSAFGNTGLKRREQEQLGQSVFHPFFPLPPSLFTLFELFIRGRTPYVIFFSLFHFTSLQVQRHAPSLPYRCPPVKATSFFFFF